MKLAELLENARPLLTITYKHEPTHGKGSLSSLYWENLEKRMSQDTDKGPGKGGAKRFRGKSHF